MNVPKLPIARTLEEAQIDYWHLSHAIVMAGFHVSTPNRAEVRQLNMDDNSLVMLVESSLDASGEALFAVVYQPVDNLFFIANKDDHTLAVSEKQSVCPSEARFQGFFPSLRNLLFPTISLALKQSKSA